MTIGPEPMIRMLLISVRFGTQNPSPSISFITILDCPALRSISISSMGRIRSQEAFQSSERQRFLSHPRQHLQIFFILQPL
jgi:hypothetical protein